METNNIRLTAPEIASLWTQYMFDTMSILFSQYALEHIDDKDIRELYETALELSINHVQHIKDFLTQENYPIPQGFTEQDVNKKAPRLFQDPFYIYYLYVMTLQGMTGYSLSVSTSIRSDIRKYYIACNKETMMLFDKTIDAMLKKGLYTRPPVIDPPVSVDFIKHQSFLTGWLGERRPLTVLEIGDITFNMIKMNLHAALKVGFIQVAKSEEVRQFIMKGHKIANKQIETFDSIFREENLNSPISWQSLVTNSTLTPFSDKYLMYQVQLSTQLTIAFYGTAFSVNARRDLSAQYILFTGELAKFAEDGANLMIKNGWLEEPPKASDRKALNTKT
ncbi:DUF3231 family protein [Paenibacillus sp. LjRoot153]|uniref:DUF3231 family protein n=1 Tax=Paenibacillus sp. LjRoot153 TaxID=3342270 RepID=UPI003ECECED6